jgi:hypothetical protein
LTGSTQTAAPQMWDRRVEPGRDQSSPRLGLGDRTLLSFQRPRRSSGAGSPHRYCADPLVRGRKKGLPKEARRQCSGAVALLAAAGLPGGLFKGHLEGLVSIALRRTDHNADFGGERRQRPPPQDAAGPAAASA